VFFSLSLLICSLFSFSRLLSLKRLGLLSDCFFILVRVPSRVLYNPALLLAILIKAAGGFWSVTRRIKTALVLYSPHSSGDSRIILIVFQPSVWILSIDLSHVAHVFSPGFNQGLCLTVFRPPSQLHLHLSVFRLMLITLVPVRSPKLSNVWF
jgi:hypothetical protein